jgi:hypothetical protein
MNDFEAEMQKLDEGIQALKIEYNRYFTGALERPPYGLQSSLEAIIRRHSVPVQGRRTAEQFRFNSLLSQFRVLTEMWNRNVRHIEEGRPSPLQRRDQEAPVERVEKERELYRATVSLDDSSPQSRTLQDLYRSYVHLAASDRASKVSYGSFYNTIHARIERYQERTGARSVIFRIVLVDNRPVLKLRSAP